MPAPITNKGSLVADDKRTSSTRRRMKIFASIMIVALTVTACGGPGGTQESGDADGLVAAVASYDIVASRPARFIVGIYTADQTRLLGYGEVSFTFTYLGDGGDTDGETGPSIGPVDAAFLHIPGQDVGLDTPGPRLVAGSEATGVYGAQAVEFDRAGFWEVAIEAVVDGRTHQTTGAFEVLARSDVPAVGDPAPRTRQALARDPGVDPKAIDSRADADRPIPDPELHDVTIDDAITARRPVMVVVSTPTFCVSRFCGPITDSVHELALRFGDRMNFIHLEVWQDFAANTLNPAAAEWTAPTPETDGGEPWVFLIDANGIIIQRFDNVATESELLAAVEALVGEPADD